MWMTLIVIALILAVYVAGVYNTLQTLKTQIKASIQEIGNQLKRQASLIPNLQASTKAYLGHEKGVYEMITKARSSVEQANKNNSGKNVEEALNNIQGLIPKISVMVESNPELKANETVGKFMSELSDTADKLMYSRRSVIDLSQNYNQKRIVFPSNIIANMFDFKEEKGLETPMSGSHVSVSTDETKDVKVKF
jgi:LemA protein